MRIIRLLMPLVLIVGFTACKRAASADQRAVALVREANELLRRSSDSMDLWIKDYMKTFTPQNRAQFPGNREQLRPVADKIIKSLDESTKLNDDAVKKYEEALALMKDGKEKQGMTLLVSATKKQSDSNAFFRSQVQLVYDEKITDEKTFNQRFLEIGEQLRPVHRQYQAEMSEGRRLLGM